MSGVDTLARSVLQRARSQWCKLEEHIALCDERIAAHGKDNAAVKKAASLIGIDPVTTSAVVFDGLSRLVVPAVPSPAPA